MSHNTQTDTSQYSSIINTIEQLENIYGSPGQASLRKVSPVLTPAYRRMVQASSFCAMATAGPDGMDCSPRGDAGSCLVIQDDKTLLMPDRRGNNRIDSLRNIVRDPRIALMLMIAGSTQTMRINGTAQISIDPDLLASLAMDGKAPRSVIIITINEIYFQCARAVMRAGLWDSSTYIDPASLPTPGEILQDMSDGNINGKAYDKEWPERASKTMW